MNPHTTPPLQTPGISREAEIRQMLIGTLREAASRLGHRKVFLFGSRALGRAKDRSDFDVGVMGDEPMPLEDFYAVEELIEALPTLYRIDWVDLARVSERFRTAALEHAEILYEA